MISSFTVFVALFLLTRLYFVQVVQGDAYNIRADRQYIKQSTTLYDRGKIFLKDRDGQLVSGATLKSGFLVALTPNEIKDPEKTYEKLRGLIPLDRDTFLSRAGKKDDPYEKVASHVEEKIAKKVEGLSIPGVHIFRERWRYYPGGTLAAQTLGFVGFQGDDYSGRYGLERYYNDTLSRDENNLSVNFFAEIFANLNFFKSRTARAGDIVTTIEPSVQLLLERKLKEISTTWNSEQTAGIIINPKNGEIYAMALYPSFNLNRYGEVKDPRRYENLLVEGVYEMGSIIKPLTIAAGLDSGAITAKTTYYDAGTLTLDGRTISNYDGRGRGTIPIQEILNQSLNTGAAFVEQKMGNDVFKKYMRAYGIGEETGVDLPGEVPGLVDFESPRDIEYATASFGQGMAITPIQTVRALSVIANGGTLITPHVGKEVKYESGLSKKISFPDGERILKPETSEEITRMLVEVVDTALKRGKVKLPRYSIAAKTGTAQIAKGGEGGYYDDRFLHTFFGYFPAYDPKFLIFLITIYPKDVRYASQTLTDPFMDMVKFLLNYYEVPPDR